MSTGKADIRIFTIGHSTRPVEEFISILQAFGVTRVADIRTIPKSRHNPQFNSDALERSLTTADIKYVHLTALGGLRHTSNSSPNTAWRNKSFRGYADYMQTPEFEAGIAELIKLAATRQTAIMCAEAVPWRCHRSLVADALSVRGILVEDIMSLTKKNVHRMTPFAKLSGTNITYPAENLD